MNVFTDKEIRKLFIFLVSIILFMLIWSQVIIYILTGDYKEQLMDHDYETAGSMLDKVDSDIVVKAFISDKTSEDLNKGRELLESSGYEKSVGNSLLPSVHKFYIKYSIIMFVSLLLFGMVLLVLIYINYYKRDKVFVKAGKDILGFMEGREDIRLPDNEEGGLSRLFSSINAMSTSLSTHIEKEKNHKEFLKDTISDISHQLKTPLAALKMYNEIILEEDSDSDTVNRFAIKSQSEIERMENLILNLLKLARLDAGTLVLEKDNTDVYEFLRNVANRFQTRAETEIKIIHINSTQKVFFSCDTEWLSEAVSNILKNALDHLQAKGEIYMTYSETPLVIKIRIEDNGAGIHPEDMSNIFKRFYRSRFSKDKQGIGIGLTISRSIVEMHGGQISVESEMGKGTAFTMIFPKLTNM